MAFSRMVQILNSALRPLDIAVIRRSCLLERFKEFDDNYHKGRFIEGHLPEGAVAYLRYDNPQLIEYKRRYEGHPAARHSLWKPERLDNQLNLAHFREDNAYIWQSRGVGFDLLISYAFATYYVKEIDALALLGKLDEDGLFGAVTFKMDHGETMSRDLLDSILEINFLERHLKLSQMPSVSVLDIGAGYGRLAYRLVKGLSNLKIVLCADAVPESTFLCQYYLGYRGVSDRAKAIPLDTIETALDTNPIDIVTNIHSFQECTVESISWWLGVISRCEIKYFMLAHYRDALLSNESDGTKRDFRPLIEMQGFELVAKEPVYAPGTLAATYGLYPERWYYLFRNKMQKAA
jgi:hypothetical protein